MLRYFSPPKPKSCEWVLNKHKLLSPQIPDISLCDLKRDIRQVASTQASEQTQQLLNFYSKLDPSPQTLIQQLTLIHCLLLWNCAPHCQFLLQKMRGIINCADGFLMVENKNQAVKELEQVDSPTFLIRWDCERHIRDECRKNEIDRCRKIVPTVPSYQQRDKIYSEDFFVCERMVRPYAEYLMKIVVREAQYTSSMDTDAIWCIINEYKKMLQVCKSFIHALRYFNNNLSAPVFNLIKLFDSEIKNTYVKLSESMTFKIEGVKEQYQELIKKCKKSSNIPNIYISKILALQAKELKQLFAEIQEINEGLHFVYLHKYFRKILKQKYGINAPEKIQTEHKQIEALCELIRLSQIQEQINKFKDGLCVTQQSEGSEGCGLKRYRSLEIFDTMSKKKEPVKKLLQLKKLKIPSVYKKISTFV